MNGNLAWATTILRQLQAAGVRAWCFSPGSRSAPLVLAAHAMGLPLRSFVDERCAASFALGHAKADGRPGVVLTTSGTAAANLLPAAVEAHESGTPLVLVTADRPPHLRGVGANQAIDQTGILGAFAGRLDLDLPSPERASLDRLAARVANAVGAAASGPTPGALHVNVPFDEPLDARSVPGEDVPAAAPAVPSPPATRPVDLAALRGVPDARRPLVVVGPWRPSDEARRTLLALAETWGAPVLADPLSGLRHAGQGGGSAAVISRYDAFLRGPVPAGMEPDLVVRIGAAPTSKTLLQRLAAWPCAQLVLRPDGAARHHGIAHSRIVAGPEAAVLGALSGLTASPEPGWRQAWGDADQAARDRLQAPDGTGGAVARTLFSHVPPGSLVWVGSSLPVRDVDLFVPAGAKPLEVLANRGASGIDGVVSAAAGAAAAQPDRPAWLLIGELSLQHDVGGLAAVAAHAPNLRIVAVHNGGGAIFRHLPVAGTVPDAALRDLFLTPQAMGIGHAAAAFGLSHRRIEGTGGLADALAGPSRVVEVAIDGAEEARRRQAALRPFTGQRG